MRDNYYLNYSVQLAITLLLPVERENLFCNNNIIIVVSTSLTGNRSSHTKFAGYGRSQSRPMMRRVAFSLLISFDLLLVMILSLMALD